MQQILKRRLSLLIKNKRNHNKTPTYKWVFTSLNTEQTNSIFVNLIDPRIEKHFSEMQYEIHYRNP